MYTIKAVSKMVNIPPVTIRAWERRYDVIMPSRTVGGHRLYSDEDISDLSWLKQQTEEKGVSISQAVKMLKDRKKNPLELTKSDDKAGNQLLSMIDELYEQLLHFKSEQARLILETMYSMYHFEKIFHELLVPVLHRAGDEWEKGKISVVQEHFISQFAIEKFYHFFHILPINKKYPKALAFCPSGEEHQIGLLLFTLFLRKKGIEVIYLGANTPSDGIYQAIKAKQISIVTISLTNKDHFKNTMAIIEDLQALSSDLSIVLGGEGFIELDTSDQAQVLSGSLPSWEIWFDSFIKNIKLV